MAFVFLSCHVRVSEWIYTLVAWMSRKSFAWNRRDIWSLSYSNGIWTHSQTGLSFLLRAKWMWVRIPLHSFRKWLARLVIYYFIHRYNQLHSSDSPKRIFNWHLPSKWIRTAITTIAFLIFWRKGFGWIYHSLNRLLLYENRGGDKFLFWRGRPNTLP